MNVTVFGSGYVGLVAAACLADIGHVVTCVDPDEARVACLQRGQMPIFEPGLREIVVRNLGRSLRFTARASKDCLSRNDVMIIAVGTPTKADGETDLSAVFQVGARIANHANGIVVIKSTVPVGTARKLQARLPYRLEVVSNPEFLREGTAVADFLYPDRIVIGTSDPRARKALEEMYRPLLHGFYCDQAAAAPAEGRPLPRLLTTSIESAELIKLAANAFLATKISFINALSAIAEGVGADVQEVAAGIGSDSRIGNAFLEAGLGFGGSCFPKDLLALKRVAAKAGEDFDLLEEVERINVDQRHRLLEKVRFALGEDLRGKRIAALGLAFKAGTDDVRESPAVDLVRSLAESLCEVAVYDPAAMAAARPLFAGQSRIEFAVDPYAAAARADALVVLTPWPEFKEIDMRRLHEVMISPVVIDGRNIYSPEAMARAGFTYISVGREAVLLEEERATGTAG